MGSYLAHGPKIYPKAHKNPRAFSCISGPIYFEFSIQCPCGVGLHHFRCSISSVSICDVPESDLRVITYDHLNFSRASVVQFRASRYIMRLNRTSEWKVMTIWIGQELPLLNFKRHDILCAWIRPPSEKLWSFELLNSFHCSISSVSIYFAPESDLRVKS